MSDSDSSSPSPSPSPPRSLPMRRLTFFFRVVRTTAGSRINKIVVFNDTTRTVVVIEGQVLDSLLRHMLGPLPASKASIDAMPRVEVAKSGIHCVICLEGFEVGEEAREMPCKHIYHSDCIQKWLRFHGTCPICRFSMPVHGLEGRKDDGDDVEEEWQVVVWNRSDSEWEEEIVVGVEDDSTTQEQDPSSQDSF